MKRISLILVLILCVSMSLYGLVVANHLQTGYEGNDEGIRSSDNQIETLIIVGGGYFLESHSHFQNLLNKVELAELTGTNYEEMKVLLTDTISTINNARTTYYDLKNLASMTPYNQTIIDRLKTFDYSNFCKSNGLNSVIFDRLKSMLSQGNITGVFIDLNSKQEKIAELLTLTKEELEKKIFPSIDNLWKINQLYFDAYLTGQYAAMIFATFI